MVTFDILLSSIEIFLNFTAELSFEFLFVILIVPVVALMLPSNVSFALMLTLPPIKLIVEFPFKFNLTSFSIKLFLSISTFPLIMFKLPLVAFSVEFESILFMFSVPELTNIVPFHKSPSPKFNVPPFTLTVDFVSILVLTAIAIVEPRPSVNSPLLIYRLPLVAVNLPFLCKSL